MKLLLAADPAAAQAMNVLGPDFDFFDVDARDREQLAACSEIAAAIKRLMTELADSGTTAVARRLSIVAGRELPSNDVKVLVDGLSGDTLNLASSEWLRSRGRRISQRFAAALRTRSLVLRRRKGRHSLPTDRTRRPHSDGLVKTLSNGRRARHTLRELDAQRPLARHRARPVCDLP